jgi:hypothetical protein
MNKICYGCGVKLQSEDENILGYIPESKRADAKYCQRCFKIMHYGINKGDNPPKSISSIVNTLNQSASFVLFLTDFITINAEVIEVFKKIKKKKILVISKCDIIPKSIKYDLIVKFIKDNYKIDDEVKLISSYNSYGINSLLKYFADKRINECYIIGKSNSGKSTLINKMIDITSANLNKITTSYIPNTTLDYLRLKLNDNLTIVDCPGFILKNDILQVGKIKGEIKPKTYQMKQGEVLKVGDMYFKVDNDTSITLYLLEQLEMKKYYKDLSFDFDLEVGNDEDIILNNLGFINVKNKCLVRIKNIKVENVSIRKSIFGRNHE